MRVHSVKPLTIPAEFNFATDNVARNRKIQKIRDAIKASKQNAPMLAKTDDGQLRISKAPNHALMAAAGRIRRFLQSAKKSTVQPFVSMAEMVNKFVKETPKRFHSRPVGCDEFVPIKMASPTRTIPTSPELETAKRTRPVHIEQSPVVPPFKAQPIDQNVFESHGDLGVPRVEKKACTVPVEFHFAIEERVQARHADDVMAEPHVEPFRANPVPSYIFAGVTGVPPKQPITLTVPESPAITKPRKITVEPEAPVLQFKAHPMPDLTQVFQPVHSVNTIEIKPFERQEQYPDPREVRAQLAAEEERKLAEMRTFHANPVPTSDPFPVPQVEQRPVTVPEPFNLESEKRHEEYVQVFTEKVEKMTEEERKAAEFKAQPVPKVAPFVPKKSQKPLTEVCHARMSFQACEYILQFRSASSHSTRSSVPRSASSLMHARSNVSSSKWCVVHNVGLHCSTHCVNRSTSESAPRRSSARRRLRLLRFGSRPCTRRTASETSSAIEKSSIHLSLMTLRRPIDVKPSEKKLTQPESPNLSHKRKSHMRV